MMEKVIAKHDGLKGRIAKHDGLKGGKTSTNEGQLIENDEKVMERNGKND